MTYSRRQFVRIVPSLGAFALAAPSLGAAHAEAQPAPAGPVWPDPPPARGKPVDDSFPSNHPALVKEMVGVSHGNVARVRELLHQQPALAQASWDWGYGDWETALGAASHVGARPIAELLLEHGAAPTIFSATMLGQLDLVKAFLAAMPGGQKIRGPHSLSLMVHAKAGRAPAAEVVKYLESLGDADLRLTDEPIAPEDRAKLDGRYTFGDRPRDSFTVTTKPNQVVIARPGADSRNLRHVGNLEFVPPGAPAVRIRFEREGATIVALTVNDPDLIVKARKIG